MRNLNFKYAGAWNFLPFGPEGFELYFEKYKNIVLIRGENRDAKPIDLLDDFKTSSNGCGKSSILDIIVYGLFGRTIKRPEKLDVNDVVHNKIKKDCKVEIRFDNYRIIRTRKENGKENKNSLRLWESDKDIWDKTTEITQGTMPTTQKQIEDIIGLSYDAFVSMCIFTDDQRSCFLECENKKKKEIVENLLSLGIYRDWFEKAKSFRKEIKVKVDIKTKEYQLLLSNQDDAKRRLQLTKVKAQDWYQDKKNELLEIEKRIISTTKKLTATDIGAALIVYEEAQKKIKDINEKVPLLEVSRDDLSKKLLIAREKEAEQKVEAQNLTKQYNDFASNTKKWMAERKSKELEIIDLESSKPGTRCGRCKGVVEEENIISYVNGLKREISDINLEIQAAILSGNEITAKIEDLKMRQKKIGNFINQFVSKSSSIEEELNLLRNDFLVASQVREPKIENAEFILQQQIEEFKKQIIAKEKEINGLSPFQDIIDNDEIELNRTIINVNEKENEIKALEAEAPYYDYWIYGFGEHGIRKWVVDGIIPELNLRINYWLNFLIDNRITLKFDNELNERIERNPVDGDPYIYHAMSTGQRRRLNLAVSQSFAHIMTLSSGSIPSIVFLDEVSTNVDPLGVQNIYNMILELAEDKQVFVTTHDQELITMLQGSDVINLIHENGFTKLA